MVANYKKTVEEIAFTKNNYYQLTFSICRSADQKMEVLIKCNSIWLSWWYDDLKMTIRASLLKELKSILKVSVQSLRLKHNIHTNLSHQPPEQNKKNLSTVEKIRKLRYGPFWWKVTIKNFWQAPLTYQEKSLKSNKFTKVNELHINIHEYLNIHLPSKMQIMNTIVTSSLSSLALSQLLGLI